MKIIIDENIAFAKEAFSPFGEVILVNGRDITNALLKNAEVLIVRSITKVNKELLLNTPVRFVGTATIGDDHIDKLYLAENNIAFTNASGCNSWSVAEYLFASVLHISKIYNEYITDETVVNKSRSIGIIGCGNIGSKVRSIFRQLGWEVKVSDPPLAKTSNELKFDTLEDCLKCDIITFHVPLTIMNKQCTDSFVSVNEDYTYHQLNNDNYRLINDCALLINTSRGEVCETETLKKLKVEKGVRLVLDVWEGEPNIDAKLLSIADVATPHIAGYSLEGKVNGTLMVYDKLSQFLGINKKIDLQLPVISNSVLEFEDLYPKSLQNLIKIIYDIEKDSELLKQSKGLGIVFDKLRKEYPYRREFTNYTITNSPNKIIGLMKSLRFNIKDPQIEGQN